MSNIDKDRELPKMAIKETTKHQSKGEVVLDAPYSQEMGCIDIHS